MNSNITILSRQNNFFQKYGAQKLHVRKLDYLRIYTVKMLQNSTVTVKNRNDFSLMSVVNYYSS